MSKKSSKLSIPRKYKNDKLTSVEFNEVVDTINNLVDDVDENGTADAEVVEQLSSQIEELNSYINTQVSPSIDELLSYSRELLGATISNKSYIDTLLEESANLLHVSQGHETRITTVEDLLSSSQRLVESLGLTAHDIPTTNNNVQQDIDSLLAQSAALLDAINTKHEEAISYTETSYTRMKEYVDDSYSRLYGYVEDTTLTFTVEGLRPTYGDNTTINEE